MEMPRTQSTNPNSAMRMRMSAMQPISSRADATDGTARCRTVHLAATIVITLSFNRLPNFHDCHHPQKLVGILKPNVL